MHGFDALAELAALEASDGFVARHIGPDEAEIAAMLANRSPEDEGWFFRLEPATPEAFGALMDRAAYEAFLETL